MSVSPLSRVNDSVSTSCWRDIVVHTRDWHSSPIALCNLVEQSTKWGGVCSITEYFQRKIGGQVLGPPSLFFGPERVWTATTSEQSTGHCGLTSKAEEEDFRYRTSIISDCLDKLT